MCAGGAAGLRGDRSAEVAGQMGMPYLLGLARVPAVPPLPGVPRVQGRAAAPAQATGRGWLILKEGHGQTLAVTSQAGSAGHMRGLRRRRETCNGGRAVNFPRARPWGAGIGVGPYLWRRRLWARQMAEVAEASGGTRGLTVVGATGLAVPWSAMVSGYSVMCCVHSSGCFCLNVSQEGMQGRPVFCPTPSSSYQLFMGRERVNKRVKRRVKMSQRPCGNQ